MHEEIMVSTELRDRLLRFCRRKNFIPLRGNALKPV